MENYYRSQLSPFGRDVLDVMIRQWRQDRIAVNKRRLNHNAIKSSDFPFPPRDYTKKRRVLTFNNNENVRKFTDKTAGFDRPSFASVGEDNELPFEFKDNRQVALNDPEASLHLIKTTTAGRPLMPLPLTDHYEEDIISTTDSYLLHARNVVADLYKVGLGSETDNTDILVERQTTLNKRHKETKNNTVTESKTLLNEALRNNTTTRCDDRDNGTNDNSRCYEPNNLIEFNKVTLSDEPLISKVNFNDEMPTDEKNKVNANKLIRHDELIVEMDTRTLPQSNEPENNVNNKNVQTCSETNNKNKQINWNDMFDTDILSQTDLLEDKTFEKIQGEGMQIKITNDSDVKRAVDYSAKVNKGIQLITDEIIEPEILKQKKDNKRKAQTKLTDKVPKKMKKIPRENKVVLEPSFKKQSYKKSVSNWLEEIEPCDATHSGEVTTSENINKTSPNKEVEKILPKYTASNLKINKSPTEKKKKVIQAQLANKDGVMKFKKPNDELGNETKKLAVVDSTESLKAEVSVETKDIPNSADSTVTDKPKEPRDKIPKSKFVAPVKSQIPVKDISYDVVDLDESNLKGHLSKILDRAQLEDITLVLMYKNGFCQLNCQDTDDSCVPEGLMLSTNDNFYYNKQTQFPDSAEIRKMMLSVLVTNNIICYDGKSLLIYLANEYKVDLAEHEPKIIDAQIAGSLLEPDDPPQDFSALQTLVSHFAEYRVAMTCARQRSAWCSMQLRASADKLRAVLRARELWPVFQDIEMQLVPIIADMERHGVCVDVDRLQAMEKCLLEQLKEAEAACHRAAGRPFQINSALQVRGLLYDELQLHTQLPSTQPVRGTGTGKKSTSEVTLRRLSSLHALPRLVLQYRHVHKSHAAHVAGVAQFVKDGRVRPTWTQTSATGRVACSGPNLQAIPKAPISLQLFPEPDQAEQRTLNLRSVYVACAGHILLAADYRHVECRVLAHVSADDALRDALAHETDLFRALAAKWLDKAAEAVSEEERERTKRVVYAKLYGAGARRLAELLDMPLDRAAALSDSFSREYAASGPLQLC